MYYLLECSDYRRRRGMLYRHVTQSILSAPNAEHAMYMFRMIYPEANGRMVHCECVFSPDLRKAVPF